MDHRVDALDGGVGALVAAHIAFDELDIVGEVGDVVPMSCGEVIEDLDFVTPSEQFIDDMRADEPTATSDQVPLRHGCPSCLATRRSRGARCHLIIA